MKLEKHVSTKWLNVGKFLQRTMIQWDSLESYFSSNFNFDDDHTENNPDGKTSREKRLENTFSQPFSKLYAMLVQFAIPIFHILNTFCKLWNH